MNVVNKRGRIGGRGDRYSCKHIDSRIVEYEWELDDGTYITIALGTCQMHKDIPVFVVSAHSWIDNENEKAVERYENIGDEPGDLMDWLDEIEKSKYYELFMKMMREYM